MAETTEISWADATFNPWIGCAKVSPGCKNCYAETLMDTRYGRVKWGKGQPRSRTSAGNWRQPIAWNRKAEGARKRWAQLGAVGSPPAAPRVFCSSLADWLDDEVPIEWFRDLLSLIAATGDLRWLMLTKRPENWRARLQAAVETRQIDAGIAMASWWLDGDAPGNVWAGTTVEDQERADLRVPQLLAIPAGVRFLSAEPLLGSVDLRQWLCDECDGSGRYFIDGTPCACVCADEPGIDWLIVGGESGAGARPMHPAWARSLRDQAQSSGVAFHFKQWGEWQAGSAHPRDPKRERIMLNDGRLLELTEDLTPYDAGGRWGSFDPNVMARVGKGEAGRELDGRTWDELPRTVRA